MGSSHSLSQRITKLIILIKINKKNRRKCLEDIIFYENEMKEKFPGLNRDIISYIPLQRLQTKYILQSKIYYLIKMNFLKTDRRILFVFFSGVDYKLISKKPMMNYIHSKKTIWRN